MTPYRNRK